MSARCRSLPSSWTGNGSPFSVRRPWKTTVTETNQNQTKLYSAADTFCNSNWCTCTVTHNEKSIKQQTNKKSLDSNWKRIFTGCPVRQLMWMQSVLRAATCLVLGLPSRASVSGAVHNTLHWFSYPQRVTYKLCLLTSVCKAGCPSTSPLQTLCANCLCLRSSWLRSADDNQFLVPRMQTVYTWSLSVHSWTRRL